MALLTDDGWIQLGDLALEDSEVQEIAQREGVDLSAKLTHAMGRVRAETQSYLRKYSNYSVEQAATDWRIWRWTLVESLGAVYRDAYFHQLNDRYSQKWKLYAQQSSEARDQAMADGIGIVFRPLPRPPAPETELTEGEQGSRTYWVAAQWTRGEGASSCVGEARLTKATTTHGLTLRMNQPAPAGAKWHVYAGAGPGELTRQTAEPLDPDAAWTLPGTGLLNGLPGGDGQKADTRVRIRRVLGRRRLTS